MSKNNSNQPAASQEVEQLSTDQNTEGVKPEVNQASENQEQKPEVIQPEAKPEEKPKTVRGGKAASQEVEQLEDGKMTGNLDKDGKYPFDESWNKGVVVRQVEIQKVNSDVVELPSTARLAVYEPAVYAVLVKNKSFSGMKITELHNPAKTINI